MTVKELITALQRLSPTSLVVLQKDAEGTGYSPAAGVDSCVYRADSTWSGELLQREEDDEQDGDAMAVVLWPVN